MDEALVSIGMLDSLSRLLVEEEQFNSISGTIGRRLFAVIKGVMLTGIGRLFKEFLLGEGSFQLQLQ